MLGNRVSYLFLVAIILSVTLPIFVECGRERIVFLDGGKTLYRIQTDKISEYQLMKE